MEKKNGREQIMKAAAKVFADKGYEGARVDEIAKEAGVTKSLLYYHFKSKEEILNVLTEQLLSEYQSLLDGIKESKDSYQSVPLKARMQEKYFPFGLDNEDLIRCAFIESLKRTDSCKVFFQMAELLKDKTDPEMMERLVLEYYFNIMPCVLFLCQKEAWCEYFHMDMDNLGKIFLEQYDKVHGNYHREEDK